MGIVTTRSRSPHYCWFLLASVAVLTMNAGTTFARAASATRRAFGRTGRGAFVALGALSLFAASAHAESSSDHELLGQHLVEG